MPTVMSSRWKLSTATPRCSFRATRQQAPSRWSVLPPTWSPPSFIWRLSLNKKSEVPSCFHGHLISLIMCTFYSYYIITLLKLFEPFTISHNSLPLNVLRWRVLSRALPSPWERERILKVWFAFTFFVQSSTSGNQNIIGRTSKYHPLPFKVSSNGGQSIIEWKEFSRKILSN